MAGGARPIKIQRRVHGAPTGLVTEGEDAVDVGGRGGDAVVDADRAGLPVARAGCLRSIPPRGAAKTSNGIGIEDRVADDQRRPWAPQTRERGGEGVRVGPGGRHVPGRHQFIECAAPAEEFDGATDVVWFAGGCEGRADPAMPQGGEERRRSRKRLGVLDGAIAAVLVELPILRAVDVRVAFPEPAGASWSSPMPIRSSTRPPSTASPRRRKARSRASTCSGLLSRSVPSTSIGTASAPVMREGAFPARRDGRGCRGR